MTTRERSASPHKGDDTALRKVEASLRAAERHAGLNAFTSLRHEEARTEARAADASAEAMPLAGMPIAVKNLFDVAGDVTLAGARINRDNPPAQRHAKVLARLVEAGAVLIGQTNMDEYAYGFSTENAHFGSTRNPHDAERIAGGSSGGSAAAVAAGIVPVALGSDTNGSVRVPASLCGVYGLKPTFGRLPRAGMFPFVESLDHVGHFARTTEDLALTYDAMQGADAEDRDCVDRPADHVAARLEEFPEDLRVGVLGGWFRQNATRAALDAVDLVASAFGQVGSLELDGAQAARSAAFCMTGIEGAHLHAERLKRRPLDFDPAVRDRLFAGMLLPATISEDVCEVRRRFREEVGKAFERFDILIAPATPCTSPKIGEAIIVVDGNEMPVRANLGIYTQPISFIGLPAMCVPVRTEGMPIGVQLIAPHWQEARLFQVARRLEQTGFAECLTPTIRECAGHA